MNNRNLKNPNTPLPEVYDDILKSFFEQGYLAVAPPVAKHIFTGENWKGKLINYLTPFLKFIKRSFEYKKRFQPHFTKENLEGKIWLFINSLNNRNSLLFLETELENTVLIGNGIQLDPADKYQLPFHQAALYTWKFPKIWLYFRDKYGKQATTYGDFLFRTVGIYEIAFHNLATFRPKCIVLSNDHSEKQRALLNAAKRLNIPVVYIQHASISDLMPPLDFDLSLLEGQGALDKYKSRGAVNGKVQLIGMPKFDNYIQYRNTSTTVKNIGICTNIFDKAEDIYKMIQAIQNKFSEINISLRPHPGYKITLNPPENVSLSTKAEHIFDFLKRQDLLIAGNSSVHLEAILLNVTSVYYQVSKMENVKDFYGYVENGLLEECEDIEVLLSVIQENINYRKAIFQNIKYYNDVIGTANEGKSSTLASQYIQDFLKEWKFEN